MLFGGGNRKFYGMEFFLSGERNLRASDFDQLKSKLTWPKGGRGVGEQKFGKGRRRFSRWLEMSEFLPGGVDSPQFPSRENAWLITFIRESFSILFYIPKVILKLHLDGKLQVTLAYYLYYKRDFSYCQTVWLLEC